MCKECDTVDLDQEIERLEEIFEEDSELEDWSIEAFADVPGG